MNKISKAGLVSIAVLGALSLAGCGAHHHKAKAPRTGAVYQAKKGSGNGDKTYQANNYKRKPVSNRSAGVIKPNDRGSFMQLIPNQPNYAAYLIHITNGKVFIQSMEQPLTPQLYAHHLQKQKHLSAPKAKVLAKKTYKKAELMNKEFDRQLTITFKATSASHAGNTLVLQGRYLKRSGNKQILRNKYFGDKQRLVIPFFDSNIKINPGFTNNRTATIIGMYKAQNILFANHMKGNRALPDLGY